MRPLSPGDFIGKWIKLIAPAYERLGTHVGPLEDHVERLALESVKQSLENLRTFPCIKTLEDRGKLALHGAYFGVATGSLLVCDREGSEFVPVAQAEHAKLLQAPRF